MVDANEKNKEPCGTPGITNFQKFRRLTEYYLEGCFLS